MEQHSHNITWQKKLFLLPRVLNPKELVLFFVLVLLGIASILGMIRNVSRQFSVPVPAFGGTLREGILGSPRFINPLLAQTDADRDLVMLTFAGLLRYDKEGNLIPALAEKYEISPDGLAYTVTLKDKLRWPDGKPITSRDVAFTVDLAKNPQLQSPRRVSWEGVEVEEINERAVRFTLKKPYSPFIENLTLGILPYHKWEIIPLAQFSLAELNMQPMGAGPYVVQNIERNAQGSVVAMTLRANKNFALGSPYMKTVKVLFYQTPEEILRDAGNNTIDTVGIDAISLMDPKEFLALTDDNKTVHTAGLQRIIGAFFNQNSQRVLASRAMRKALTQAIDKNAIVQEALREFGVAIDSPLPPRIIVPDKNEIAQSYNPEAAQSAMQKSKEPVAFTLTVASKTPTFARVAEMLKAMWEKSGAKVDIRTFERGDLEQLVLGPRRYDIFLIGEELIGNNPDPFAFWHSSQRTHPGLNVALYANSKVDALLEQVRAEHNPEKQRELYQSIHDEITKDAPAVFLFSPFYLYVAPKQLQGVSLRTINSGSERFAAIHQWYLKTDYVWSIFKK